MKLDHECVRDIMCFLEETPYVSTDKNGMVEYNPIFLDAICHALSTHKKEDIYYTLSNLEQAGLIDLSTQWADGGVYVCMVNYITYEGHEFLDKIRSETVWKQTIATAEKIGNFSLTMIAKIAEGVATAYLNKILSVN